MHNSSRLIALSVLAIVSLSACAGGTPSVEILPIEEVSLAGPPRFEDITSHDAILVFESGIPLACSVVYGETTAYGSIATDLDMSGGAHTDHHPLITELKPDTEYHYRVQGTSAEGVFYMSGDLRFRTLPEPDETELNLASLAQGAAIIAVSSNFGGAANDEPWGALNAIDGNRGTAWSSDGDGDEAFLEIKLAGQAQLSAIEVWSRSMADGTAEIYSFTLTTDGGEVLGPFELEDTEQAHRFPIDVMARSLLLEIITSSGGNTGLVEFAAYGTLLKE